MTAFEESEIKTLLEDQGKTIRQIAEGVAGHGDKLEGLGTRMDLLQEDVTELKDDMYAVKETLKVHSQYFARRND